MFLGVLAVDLKKDNGMWNKSDAAQQTSPGNDEVMTVAMIYKTNKNIFRQIFWSKFNSVQSILKLHNLQ